MSGHTKGPWNIAPKVQPYIATSDDPKIKEWLVSSGADRFNALSVGTVKGSVAIIPLDESNEANARLIAAAPELLEALESVNMFLDDMHILPVEQTVRESVRIKTMVLLSIRKAVGK